MTAPGLEEHSGNQRNEMPTAQSACRPASFSAAKSSMTIGYGHDFPELPGRRQVLRHAQLCCWQDRRAETFLELYLFEQEIGHRTPKTGEFSSFRSLISLICPHSIGMSERSARGRATASGEPMFGGPFASGGNKFHIDTSEFGAAFKVG